MTVEVIQTPAAQIEITTPAAPSIEINAPVQTTEVRTHISQPVAGGMYVETNIGGDPDAFTIWIEDGK